MGSQQNNPCLRTALASGTSTIACLVHHTQENTYHRQIHSRHMAPTCSRIPGLHSRFPFSTLPGPISVIL